MTVSSNTPVPPKGITLRELARCAKLSAGIKALTDEHKVLVEKIKQAYAAEGVTGKNTFAYPAAGGAIVVDLSTALGVDLTSLAEDYPVETYPTYYKSSIDTSKVPADLVEKYRVLVTNRLSVKRASA